MASSINCHLSNLMIVGKNALKSCFIFLLFFHPFEYWVTFCFSFFLHKFWYFVKSFPLFLSLFWFLNSKGFWNYTKQKTTNSLKILITLNKISKHWLHQANISCFCHQKLSPFIHIIKHVSISYSSRSQVIT